MLTSKLKTVAGLSILVLVGLILAVYEFSLSVSAEEPRPTVSASLLEAVAPYDAAGAANELVMAIELAHPLNVGRHQCLADQGVVPDDVSSPQVVQDPDILIRDNPTRFPHLESLREEGFLNQITRPDDIGDAEPPPEDATESELPPGFEDALITCQEDAGMQEAAEGYELFASLAVDWQGILDEIDASEEVQSLRQDFSSCLQAEGVPAESASHELAFLGHVDSLILNQRDLTESAHIYRDYGQMYARCGEPMFAHRESLFLGQRDRFLEEHRETLVALDDYLQSE